MQHDELHTEQIILEAAEAEFLEKGYGNTKMVAIAKRAGVSHSMLHYYFKTKENLFQTIFLKKMQSFLQLLEGIFIRKLPFTETVRFIIETLFHFAEQNPQLPYFILNEILLNKKNRTLFLSIISPKIINNFSRLEKILINEIKKGAVRPIKPFDLMLNIISLNIFTFISLPVWEEIFSLRDKKMMKKMLDERRESNVQFVLNALKP
ncbi:MAG: TetR/AcrR family transcriptional regulator [Bacteroidales bacterium]|jgi:AcrR family transcriptional regulator|nr:TetR/AcrR family transcriptional regulator [Bacteroidales bacterium]